jgi:hypothetical protein
MFKRLTTIVGAMVLISFLGLFAVGSVFAQGPTPTPPQTPWQGAWGRVCQGAGVVSDALSKLLGMTPEQIYAERSAGKTLAEIAKDKGVTDQQLIDAIVAGRAEVIAQAVKDGRMTQAQADWMLAKMKAMAPFQISNPFGPHGGMRGGHMGGCFQPETSPAN